MSRILRTRPLFAARIVERPRKTLEAARKGNWIIDAMEDAAVVGEDLLPWPQRLEIETHCALVSAQIRALGIGMQAAFLIESARELGVRQCVEEAHHANRNRRFLDQLNHSFRHRLRLAIEADYEARGHKKTGGVDRVDAVRNVTPRVLLFTHRNKRRSVRALDADKDPYEIGTLQQQQELGVVGEIERGFGRELEWITLCFEPVCELWQERLDGFLIANKVVIDEVDIAPIAKPVELVEFGKHLGVRFDARDASVKLDDVAKLAR